MRKFLIPFSIVVVFSIIFTSCDLLGEVAKELELTEGDVANGLKEALSKGTNAGTASAGAVNGYLKNELIKILLPDEIQQVQGFLGNPPDLIKDNTLLNIAFNTLTGEIKEVPNKLLIAMNRGAEAAAPDAKDIFLTAITNMTIQDAFAILKGDDKQAATNYLRKVTTDSIISKFTPKINAALGKTEATKYFTTIVTKYNGFIPKYNSAVSTYNLLASNKLDEKKSINPDLGAYATERAAEGLFKLIAKEEEEIRKNPLARTTDLLRRVFKEQDN